MIQRLAKQIQNMIKRGFVSNTNSDAGQFPTIQVSFMGKVADVETLWPYGYSAMPPINSLVTIFNNQGQEEYKMAICTDPQGRITGMSVGEVAVSNNVMGNMIYFAKDGSIQITASAAANITINAPGANVVMNAQNLIVNGQIKATGDITDNYATNTATMAGFRAIYDIHTHNETGTVTHVPNQIV